VIVCVLADEPPEGGVLEVLLHAAPRVALEGSCVWLDARGLDVEQLYERLRCRLKPMTRVRAGASTRAVAAYVAAAGGSAARAAGSSAARAAGDSAARLEVVPAGTEREFVAPCSLAQLGMEDPLLGWLADVGVGTCGELAALARESVEVRFGGDAVRWWKLARAEDERRLFVPVPPAQPNASVDFIDYVVTDPERLIFTANALLGGLCEQMRERGAHARRIRLRLPLANGEQWERTLRTARPTADRTAWLRLARLQLEKLTVPDAVSGVGVAVEATEAAAALQGDLFDIGFATSAAVETAVARLVEDHGDIVQQPAPGEHPLVEQRGEFRPLALREVLQPPPAVSAAAPAVPAAAPPADEAIGLTLQLLPEPRPILVEAVQRRDHAAPVRYRDRKWHVLLEAAGPDRVSGGQWEDTYAREYFRGVTGEGSLVWLFRDAVEDRWYLHGWWD
jgi:protein ImuB